MKDGSVPKPCGFCGHNPACGYAQAEGHWLCHTDDHSCYEQWTVHGQRSLGDTLHVQDATPARLLEICERFEDVFSMSSEDFYARYVKGEFIGIHDSYRWAGYWTAYLRSARMNTVK